MWFEPISTASHYAIKNINHSRMSSSFLSKIGHYGSKNPMLMGPDSNIQEGHSLYSALLKTLLQMRTLMITGPGIS